MTDSVERDAESDIRSDVRRDSQQDSQRNSQRSSQRSSQRNSQRGSGHHVADIYERYAPHIAAYALRRTTNTDAADVVAETFLVAWRRRDVVPEEPSTLPWLCGVARRVLANQRRSHRRRGRLSDRLTAEFTEHTVGPAPFEDSEEFRRVARAIDKLSDDDAELLRLIAWEALTPSDVAIAMGIAPGTARQRISRARQRLQKQLASDGYEADIERPATTDRRNHPGPIGPPNPKRTFLNDNTRGGVAP